MKVPVEHVLDVFNSTIGGKRAVYCSVPITTGRRLVEWLERTGTAYQPYDSADRDYLARLTAEVVDPNRREAANFVERMRGYYSPGPFINPSALRDVYGWDCSGWMELWAGVIGRFSKMVIAADGWEFSAGCTQEVALALSTDLPVLDGDLRSIKPREAAGLLESAIGRCSRHGIHTQGLEASLGRVMRL